MIDYEKLKLAHELILKAPEKYSLACYVGCSFDAYYRIYSLNSDFVDDYDDIDILIANLQELTKPKPKYEIGQKVWFVDCNAIFNSKIDAVGSCQEEYCVDDSKNRTGKTWYHESELYPSREALIEAQIEFWTSLKNDEKSTHSDDMSMSPPFEGAIIGFDHSVDKHEKVVCDECIQDAHRIFNNGYPGDKIIHAYAKDLHKNYRHRNNNDLL